MALVAVSGRLQFGSEYLLYLIDKIHVFVCQTTNPDCSRIHSPDGDLFATLFRQSLLKERIVKF